MKPFDEITKTEREKKTELIFQFYKRLIFIIEQKGLAQWMTLIPFDK